MGCFQMGLPLWGRMSQKASLRDTRTPWFLRSGALCGFSTWEDPETQPYIGPHFPGSLESHFLLLQGPFQSPGRGEFKSLLMTPLVLEESCSHVLFRCLRQSLGKGGLAGGNLYKAPVSTTSHFPCSPFSTVNWFQL